MFAMLAFLLAVVLAYDVLQLTRQLCMSMTWLAVPSTIPFECKVVGFE